MQSQTDHLERVRPLVYRKADLTQLLGVSPMWLHREVQAGRFPAPKQLSRRSVGWLSADVERWLAERPSTVSAN